MIKIDKLFHSAQSHLKLRGTFFQQQILMYREVAKVARWHIAQVYKQNRLSGSSGVDDRDIRGRPPGIPKAGRVRPGAFVGITFDEQINDKLSEFNHQNRPHNQDEHSDAQDVVDLHDYLLVVGHVVVK